MMPISSTYSNLITWWENGTLRIECRHHRGGYQVRTLRAEQVTSECETETETRARELFERAVACACSLVASSEQACQD